jgi:hypothetical protein
MFRHVVCTTCLYRLTKCVVVTSSFIDRKEVEVAVANENQTINCIIFCINELCTFYMASSRPNQNDVLDQSYNVQCTKVDFS